MVKTKLDTGDWIVVCDGRKALILQNDGDAKFPNLHVRETREQVNPSTHEQGASPPGRSHQSVGQGRSAVEQTDWHDEAERAFLTELAQRLHAAVAAGETRRLAVIAPPRALGMLRKVYTTALSESIVREIGKDMVKMPVSEIEREVFA